MAKEKALTTIRIVLGWFFGVIFAFAGLGAFLSFDFIHAGLLAVIVILCIPLLNEKIIPKKTKLNGIKIIPVVFILLLLIYVIPTNSSENLPNDQTTKVDEQPNVKKQETTTSETKSTIQKSITEDDVIKKCSLCDLKYGIIYDSKYSDQNKQCYDSIIECLYEATTESDFKGEAPCYEIFHDQDNPQDVRYTHAGQCYYDIGEKLCDVEYCDGYLAWMEWGPDKSDMDYYLEERARICDNKILAACAKDDAVSSGDVSNCSNLEGDNKYICILNLAKEYNDISLCSENEDLEIDGFRCITAIAMTERDFNTCGEGKNVIEEKAEEKNIEIEEQAYNYRYNNCLKNVLCQKLEFEPADEPSGSFETQVHNLDVSNCKGKLSLSFETLEENYGEKIRNYQSPKDLN